jgi:three-Cys-motif partner protein
MSTDDFFEKPTESSRVKSTIIEKYFDAWSNVMAGVNAQKSDPQNLGYIDLYSGPGTYEDGTPSTPILILMRAIDKAYLRNHLVTVFNDIDSDHARRLEAAIRAVPDIDKLKYAPTVGCFAVKEDVEKLFQDMRMVPTFSFIDPWGYKGLTLGLLASLVKDWGSDCVFFFNARRINQSLTVQKFAAHIDALFGPERASALRTKVTKLSPRQRQTVVLDELLQAIRDVVGKFVIPFCFRSKTGNSISHYLIFVSKEQTGYQIMKEIMAKESSSRDDGVASFGHNPADVISPGLFAFTKPLSELHKELPSTFAGRTMTMEEIYLDHNVGTPYIACNYKVVLNKLEESGLITADPPASKRRRMKGQITFGKNVKVTFKRG